MFASFVEEDLLEELSWAEKKVFREKTLSLRWVDDVIHVVDQSAPFKIRKLVRKLARQDTYGKELQLLRSDDAQAFGFL